MKTHLELIKSVEREIKLRDRVYPGQIRWHRMTREQADHEMECMRQVLEFLRAHSPQQDLFQNTENQKPQQ